jgi:hypothetical protein
MYMHLKALRIEKGMLAIYAQTVGFRLAEESPELAAETPKALLQIKIVETTAFFFQSRLSVPCELFQTLQGRISEALDLVLDVLQQPARLALGFLFMRQRPDYQGDGKSHTESGKYGSRGIFADSFIDGSARAGILHFGFM